MGELSFTTKPKVHHVPDVPFTLDEQEFVASAPKRAAWAALLAAKDGDVGQQLSAVGMFLDACLSKEDAYVLERRLKDQGDDLDLDDLLAVVEALTREWEPYLGDELAELTGNRETRRAVVREPQDRQRPRRTAAKAAARKTTAAARG